MANVVRHAPCPKCGSRDNRAEYDDGGWHCFGCEDHGNGTEGPVETKTTEPATKNWDPIEVEVRAMPNRGLTQETIAANDYGWGEYKGKPCHVANFRDERGALIAQKLRLQGKEFVTLGAGKNLGLWLMWKFGGGKHLVITEGELDALSVRQAMDNKWPVVSLPNGVKSAEKAIAKDYDKLCKFDRIVLMFDMDKPGQDAAELVAAMLPPGKAAIAVLPEKDANDVLRGEGPGAIIKAFWNAPQWRPDGIRHVKDLKEAFLNPPEVRGIPYPWQQWNEVLGPMRLGALVTLTAGTGVGKSTILRELLYHALVTHNEPCGALFLEETNVETLESLVSIRLDANIMMDRKLATPEKAREAFEFLEQKPLYLYDHFGSNDVDNICDKIRYLVKACGVHWVFLDHISILVSGLDGDERRTIDMAMTKLAMLASELNCGIFCVVHLKRPQGDKGHEDGAEVHLGQLRGSHSIAQLSHVVIGVNRPEGQPESTVVMPVCLKNRHNGGRKGSLGQLNYDRMTGRLSDCVF